MEQLDKMYETLNALQELGLKVSPEQLNAVKDREREYLDKEIIPYVKETLETLVGKMILKFELSVTYDRINGVQIVKLEKPATSPNLFGETKRNQSSERYYIRVIYPDGHADCDKRVSHTFLNVVNYAGPEKVRQLGLTCMGDNIVSDKIMEDPRYVRAQYDTNVEGLYLMTCSSTDTKLAYMKNINKALQLGLKFEKVMR